MKKSILLYLDQKEVFETLTDDQAGKLIKAIFQYEADKIVPELDPMLKIIFIPIRQAVDRNAETYEKVCKKNAENISKRWKGNTKNTTGKSGKTKNTKNTNRDSNSNSDPGSDPKNKKGIIKVFVPPSVDDVILYFFQNGYSEAGARKAHEYYAVADWHDKDGNKVNNWKQKMLNNWFKPEYKIVVLNAQSTVRDDNW